MALTNKLTAIADAIRTKTGGSTQLSLDDMATAITGISTGGGDGNAKISEINVPGASYLLSATVGGTNFFYDTNKVSYPFTFKILNFDYQYAGNQAGIAKMAINRKDLSNFILDFSNIPSADTYSSSAGFQLTEAFAYSLCETANDLPLFVWDENKTLLLSGAIAMLRYANRLKNISLNLRNFIIKCVRDYAALRPTSINAGIPQNAYNLEDSSFITDAYRGINNGTANSYGSFGLNGNIMMKTVTIPQIPMPASLNAYINITITDSCISHFVFEPFTYDNNFAPKSATIDLTKAGYVSNANMLNVARPILQEMGRYEITDANKSQAYTIMNNPNYWTALLASSFYYHDSAVETINSLPDVTRSVHSNKGSFVLKLKAGAGAYSKETYNAGNMNQLTSAEKAVATNKGWTITLS